MEGNQFYIILLVVIVSWIIFINQFRNRNKALKIAASFLNTEIHRGPRINTVEGFYKKRKITFSNINYYNYGKLFSSNSRWNYIITPFWFFTIVFSNTAQISINVKVKEKKTSEHLHQPTPHTYLKEGAVYYQFPSERGINWVGLRLGFENLYKEKDLTVILDELVQAAEIVEKQDRDNPDQRSN